MAAPPAFIELLTSPSASSMLLSVDIIDPLFALFSIAFLNYCYWSARLLSDSKASGSLPVLDPVAELGS